MPAKKAKPGTERYRDEQRSDAKPKMHGKQWHDHRGVIEGEQASHLGASVRGPVREIGETKGMRTPNPKRKRMTPIGKGRKGERSR